MNKPNKAELEYFIRYSLDSDKYKRYMELYEEIERLKKALSDINDILNSDVDVNPFCEWQVNEIADIVEQYFKGVDKE